LSSCTREQNASHLLTEETQASSGKLVTAPRKTRIFRHADREESEVRQRRDLPDPGRRRTWSALTKLLLRSMDASSKVVGAGRAGSAPAIHGGGACCCCIAPSARSRHQSPLPVFGGVERDGKRGGQGTSGGSKVAMRFASSARARCGQPASAQQQLAYWRWLRLCAVGREWRQVAEWVSEV
jgi:hypothetical protein